MQPYRDSALPDIMSYSTTPRQVRACLVGKTGAGKSSLCNLLCPGVTFATSSSAASLTTEAQQGTYHHTSHGIQLTLVDTMGLADTNNNQAVVRQKITDGLKAMVGGVDFFFLIIKKERFTDESYLIVTYLFKAILGQRALNNLWVVVTHAGDLAEDQAAQASWIHESRTRNAKFDKVMGMVGAQRMLFIENETSRNPRMEAICAERREEARRLLLDVMKANNPTPFTIQAIEKVQKEYDEKKAAADAKRKAAEEEHQKKLINAASELEREKARAALREAKLKYQLELEQAKREAEAKAHAEVMRRMEEATRNSSDSGFCILF